MSERMMGKIYYLPVPSRTYRYDYLLGMFTRGILQVGSGTFNGSIGVAYDTGSFSQSEYVFCMSHMTIIVGS